MGYLDLIGMILILGASIVLGKISTQGKQVPVSSPNGSPLLFFPPRWVWGCRNQIPEQVVQQVVQQRGFVLRWIELHSDDFFTPGLLRGTKWWKQTSSGGCCTIYNFPLLFKGSHAKNTNLSRCFSATLKLKETNVFFQTKKPMAHWNPKNSHPKKWLQPSAFWWCLFGILFFTFASKGTSESTIWPTSPRESPDLHKVPKGYQQ